MPDLINSSMMRPPQTPASFEQNMIFWSNEKTWYELMLRLFFETEGVVSMTLICLTLFAVYRLSGSPLDVSAETNQVERESAWSDHNARFAPKHHSKWLRAGPAGEGVNSWSGTGENASIRKEAAMGDARYKNAMPSRENVMIASYDDDADGVVVSKSSASASASAGRTSADGIAQEANKEGKMVTALRLAREGGYSPSIKTITVRVDERDVKVCIVGDPKTATISFVTVHDICTNHKSGLLQMSVETIALLETEKLGATVKKPSVCFYHIVIPGHDLSATATATTATTKKEEKTPSSPPTPTPTNSLPLKMATLAALVNKVIATVPITGRYILLGEGAGAHIVLLAASEMRQRDIDNQASLNKAVRTGGLMTGVAMIQGEVGGATVGENIYAKIGDTMHSYGFTTAALKYFGVCAAISTDPDYIEELESMDSNSVLAYAKGYYTTRFRDELDHRQTRVLNNLPSIVFVSERSEIAKAHSLLMNSKLDGTRGSGVIPVTSNGYFGENYMCGGGAMVKDAGARAGVIGSLMLFIEAM